MTKIGKSAAAIVQDARDAYEAAKAGDGAAAAAEALTAAVEAFHLGQLLTRKGPIGKAARKRAEAVSAPSPSPKSRRG
jgi:hypothetical protein